MEIIREEIVKTASYILRTGKLDFKPNGEKKGEGLKSSTEPKIGNVELLFKFNLSQIEYHTAVSWSEEGITKVKRGDFLEGLLLTSCAGKVFEQKGDRYAASISFYEGYIAATKLGWNSVADRLLFRAAEDYISLREIHKEAFSLFSFPEKIQERSDEILDQRGVAYQDRVFSNLPVPFKFAATPFLNGKARRAYMNITTASRLNRFISSRGGMRRIKKSMPDNQT